MIVTENDIELIFENFDSVRYAAFYIDGQLVNKQKFQVHNAIESASKTIEFIENKILSNLKRSSFN
jgi:hypothetical protein